MHFKVVEIIISVFQTFKFSPCIHHMRAMVKKKKKLNLNLNHQHHSRPWVYFAIKGPARATPSWTSASAMQEEKRWDLNVLNSKTAMPLKIQEGNDVYLYVYIYIYSIVSGFHAPVKPFETCLIVSHPSHVLTSFTGDCNSKRFHSWNPRCDSCYTVAVQPVQSLGMKGGCSLTASPWGSA